MGRVAASMKLRFLGFKVTNWALTVTKLAKLPNAKAAMTSSSILKSVTNSPIATIFPAHSPPNGISVALAKPISSK